MFGPRKFGNPLAMTPENSMANIPVMGQQTGPMIDPRMTEQPKRGGGIFGRQSALWKVLGTLGDGLTGNPAYGQMQMQERQSLMQQEQERQKMQMQQQQRMDDRAYEESEWTRRQEYERNNPKPINNDTVNDLNWYKSLSDADRKLYHQMKPTVAFRADGTPIVVNPYDLQGFEKAPEGVTFTPIEGGSAGNGTGGFR